MWGFVASSCITCGQPITFHPHKVPSIKVSRNEEGKLIADENGTREPLCRGCAEIVNDNRVAAGLEPVPIQPDAYGVFHESEL